jgi:hypothetical protein
MEKGRKTTTKRYRYLLGQALQLRLQDAPDRRSRKLRHGRPRPRPVPLFRLNGRRFLTACGVVEGGNGGRPDDRLGPFQILGQGVTERRDGQTRDRRDLEVRVEPFVQNVRHFFLTTGPALKGL